MADLLHSFVGLLTSRTYAQRLKDTVTNDGYRHVELEGRGYYMALLISHADIPPNIKPAAGGVVFTQVDKKVFEEGIDKEALIQKAKAAAKEIDLASALWNTYLRGGAMAIISDGTRSKKDILKEVAVTLAHNHVLGWQFIAIADLGTFEKDINIIRDAVYEETLKTYLRDTPLYGDDHERRRIERILNTRQWDSLDARFIWEEGIAMPVWGRGEDRPWELAGTAFIGALETLLNANKEGHVIADIDNNFPNILVYGAGGRVGRAITGAIIRELSGRACLHGVSDEGGAVYQSVELDPYSVMDYIERKNSGEVVTFAPLDRNYNSDKDKVYRYSKDQLFQFLGKETDILVLAERGRTLTDDEVRGMQAKVVIEALPGILTESQIEILRGQGKRYIPPHCIYGATFYGVRESLMHRIIPKESRHIGDLYAHIQSGVREYSVAAMYEVLDRIDLESKADISRPGIRTVTKELCEQILNEEHLLWEELRKIASDKLNKTLEELTGIRDGREMADSIAPFADSQEMKDVLELTRINYYPKGRVSAIALMTAVAEVARNKIIYGEGSRVRAMRYLAGEDLMKKELAAFHMARLQDADAIDLLLKNLKEEFIEKGFASYRVRANCAKALGFIYQKAGSDDKKKIFEGLVSALGDSSAEAASWARWAIITNDIGITTAIQALESEIPEKEDQIRVTAEQGYDTQSPRLVLAELYFKTGNLYALRGNKTHALKSYKEAQEIAQHFLQTYNFMLPLRVQILLARINEEIEADKESAINSYLRLVSRRQFIDIGKFTNDALPKSIQHYYRQFALQAILGIYRPYGTNVNIRTASEINDIIESLNEGVFSGSVSGTNDIRGAIEYIENTCGGDLAGYNIPYLGLLILYATDLLTLY
ncbi:MAG: hypothetical protein NTY34_03740, partial [Candidatus Omnitrophica bacterium]|nr:hypothetical protein [Candidatus Omnitrophota bacterium]